MCGDNQSVLVILFQLFLFEAHHQDIVTILYVDYFPHQYKISKECKKGENIF